MALTEPVRNSYWLIYDIDEVNNMCVTCVLFAISNFHELNKSTCSIWNFTRDSALLIIIFSWRMHSSLILWFCDFVYLILERDNNVHEFRIILWITFQTYLNSKKRNPFSIRPWYMIAVATSQACVSFNWMTLMYLQWNKLVLFSQCAISICWPRCDAIQHCSR